MERPDYFQTALSSFTTDVACGGAIRHLTDIGYTLDQIVERLDYPASREKVQRIMMAYLYDSRVLLKEEPSLALFTGREEYVQEQDVYGRRTMRRIVDDQNSQNKPTNMPDLTPMSQNGNRAEKQKIFWNESVYDARRDGKLTELLHRKRNESGEELSYISCDFSFLNIDRNGYWRFEEPQGGSFNVHAEQKRNAAVERVMNCLNSRQRDYLKGICWEHSVVYHRLNQRMLEIVGKLYEAGVYQGVGFFVASQEKIRIAG